MRTTVTVRTRDDARAMRASVHDFSERDGQVRFSVDRTELDDTMANLTRLGIEELTVTPASLEDLFLREYQGATP
jgi:ABC-2 type transport system ATP-binding protein